MSYTFLPTDVMAQELKNRLYNLEAEHYRLSLDKKQAESLLKSKYADVRKDAAKKIIDLEAKIEAIDLAISALTDGQ